jgi:Polysaccharide pyruvyl transferase.
MKPRSDKPLILLRSSWQTVNIGDVAHTPGLLRTLQRFYPRAEVVLWPCNLDRGAREMMLRHFPDLRIVEGTLDSGGKPGNAELAALWDRADFFLHGSGPGMVAWAAAGAWHRTTGKPFGYFGVTTDSPGAERMAVAAHADFVLTRDTISLTHLEKAGLRGPHTEFCPDATFACDLRDDEAGDRSLAEEGLKEKRFVCMIPRLRYTPRHIVYNQPRTADDERRDAVNEQYAEKDHAKMREAAIRVVRETDMDVYLCPEMTYQLDLMDDLLFNPLPDDVKPRVHVRRRYWLPDEAASVYARAASVVSFECHSPILALRQGTPVIHLRQPTDTIKGQMWRDVGLSDYLLEIDEVSGTDVAEVLLGQIRDPQRTEAIMRRAIEFADACLERGARLLEESCTRALERSAR